MPERQPMTTRLKTLFQRPELFVLAGGINPIGARMAEALGYDAFYMSGGNTSAHQLGWPDSGTSMRDMVDNARKIVLTVQIPVFADADTGYGDAISTHYTVREYIQACIAGAHIEDQTFPPKSGPRRRCISIEEMVGKLRAAMDAKQALDPDFVIMARCDLGGVPGASFAEIIERCQAYKAEAQVDVICPNGLRTWEEIQEAIRLIPGPVVPIIPAHLSPYPSLQAQQDAGAAAAWFPALTTMAGLQANWDFLSDFQQRGTLALDALRTQAAQSPWGVASNGRILDEPRLRSMEEMYLPDYGRKDAVPGAWMTLKIASSASICWTSATSRSLLVGLPMCTNGEAIYRTIVAVVLTMLALAFPWAQAGFSQAIGTAPLLTQSEEHTSELQSRG